MSENNLIFPTTRIGNFKTVCCTRSQLARLMVTDAISLRTSSEKSLPKLVFSSNGQGLALAAHDQEFKNAMDKADIIHADGMPVVIFSKLTKSPLPDRIATTDFFHDAAKAAMDEDIKFFMLGATEEENKAAVDAIKKTYPDLKIVGRRNGYFSEDESDSICREIVDSGADVLWVALGKPKQEHWSVDNREKLRGVSWIKTCGGLYAFLSEKATRAPLWMQKSGLEWLYRAWKDPKRLMYRYLTTNVTAIIQMIKKSDYK